MLRCDRGFLGRVNPWRRSCRSLWNVGGHIIYLVLAGELVCRPESGEVPALAIVDAGHPERNCVVSGFHALDDDCGTSFVSEVHPGGEPTSAAPATWLRSSLIISDAVSKMWRSDENPAPTSSMASRNPCSRSGLSIAKRTS